MRRIYLPHAIAVGLHVDKADVVILIPEIAGSMGVSEVAYPSREGFPSRTKP